MVQFFRAVGGWAFAVCRDGERVRVWRIQRDRWVEQGSLPAVAHLLAWPQIATAHDLSEVRRAREAGLAWAETLALTMCGGLPSGSFPGTSATALVYATELPEDEETDRGALLCEVTLEAARDRWVELCASKVQRALATLREAVERVERLVPMDLDHGERLEIGALAHRLLVLDPDPTRSTLPAPMPMGARDTVPLLALAV